MKDLYPVEKPVELPTDYTVTVGVICPLLTSQKKLKNLHFICYGSNKYSNSLITKL